MSHWQLTWFSPRTVGWLWFSLRKLLSTICRPGDQRRGRSRLPGSSHDSGGLEMSWQWPASGRWHTHPPPPRCSRSWSGRSCGSISVRCQPWQGRRGSELIGRSSKRTVIGIWILKYLGGSQNQMLTLSFFCVEEKHRWRLFLQSILPPAHLMNTLILRYHCVAVIILHFSPGHSLTRILEDLSNRQTGNPMQRMWLLKERTISKRELFAYLRTLHA